MNNQPMIFISCGQFTDDERALGKAICSLVQELTPYRPYFAEYQTSLEGLTKNILEALNESVGMIAVLHPRGTVSFPGGSSHVRGSVWVEQEIAIAAFLSQIHGHHLNTAAFVHESVQREGMRDQLLLNPRKFNSSVEVLSHLEVVLPSWKDGAVQHKTPADLSFTSNVRRIEDGTRYCQLVVSLVNKSLEKIEQYHLDVEFPIGFMDQSTIHTLEVPQRRTATHRFFRETTDRIRRTLYPGDPVQVMVLDYMVTQELLDAVNGHQSGVVKAMLYIPGQQKIEIERNLQDLQK